MFKEIIAKHLEDEKLFVERLQHINKQLEDILEIKKQENQKAKNFLKDLERQVNDLKFDAMRKTPKTACLWDSIPEQDRMKPMSLSCPCPKCSSYSLTILDGLETMNLHFKNWVEKVN